jgi:HD superfamily phosphohydrolase
MTSLDALKSGINAFCECYLPAEIDDYQYGKIVHDTTWGTNFFEPYEISLINTPLIQRLRYINQMGFTNYVYPSARHSRFEHSLGVAILVGRMFDYSLKTGEHFLNEGDRISVRISALLHDVGHCLYSHTSEMVYDELLGTAIKDCFQDKPVNPSPHEFLSYLIITSEAFGRYFKKLSRHYNIVPDIREIAYRIVGGADSESKRHITSFINGPFDADKIDYFHRDSQFSGIPIQLDLDRLFYEIAVSDLSSLNGTGEILNDLTMGSKGVTCIEQLIFNKMLLYTTVYNHHKVQAIDCMFKGIFEYIARNDIKIKINGTLKTIESPVDFLYLVDFNLFSIVDEVNDPVLKKLIKNIQNRKLLKRALIINRNSVKSGDLLPLLSTSINRTEKKKYLRKLAEKIYMNAGVSCDPCEIWIDIPKIPSFKEATMTYIRTNRDKNISGFRPISDYYPYNQFKELYELHKLEGYVFAPEDCLDKISKSAEEIFKSELSVEFQETAFLYHKA